MKTVNQERVAMQGHRFYPRGLLGEMLLGVLMSMIIGIGFSILAAGFILILAGGGGRIELIPASVLPPQTPFTTPFTAPRPVQQAFLVSHR